MTWSPIAGEFVACKVCGDVSTRNVNGAVEFRNKLRNMLPSTAKKEKFAELVEIWISSSSRKERKALSHNGALRCRDSEDPIHYVDKDSKLTYFDPSNSIYAKALRLMVPDGSHLLGLNEETAGDIFESFLGTAWQNRRESFRRKYDVASQQIQLASALEDFVYALYKVERAGLDYLV